MPNRSIPEIFTDVVNQFTALLTKEGQLARTEMSEKVTQVAAGLGLILGGSVLLTPALVILLQAGVSALITNNIVKEPWAALIVGGVVLLIGIILLLIGISRLKADVSVRDETDQARYVVDLVLEYLESGLLLKQQAVLFTIAAFALAWTQGGDDTVQ